MKRFFSPNINRRGRIVRAVSGAAILVGSVFLFQFSWLAGVAVAAIGIFVLFEAFRGWCLLRACGIKTRL